MWLWLMKMPTQNLNIFEACHPIAAKKVSNNKKPKEPR